MADHGTVGRFRSGCRCEICTAFMRLYNLKGRYRRGEINTSNALYQLRLRAAERDLKDAIGGRVEPDIAIEVVQRLKDQYGMTIADIARRAELDYATVHGLVHGRTRRSGGRINSDTAWRIYGVEGWAEAEMGR